MKDVNEIAEQWVKERRHSGIGSSFHWDAEDVQAAFLAGSEYKENEKPISTDIKKKATQFGERQIYNNPNMHLDISDLEAAFFAGSKCSPAIHVKQTAEQLLQVLKATSYDETGKKLYANPKLITAMIDLEEALHS